MYTDFSLVTSPLILVKIAGSIKRSMNLYIFNFTTFDVQLWPPPLKTDPKVYADHTLSPAVFLPLLLVYHAIVSIALQTRNFRDYEGRRDTIWYRICLWHLFVLECFLIHFAIIYQKHSSLSDNIALILYTTCGVLVHSVVE